MDIGSLARMGQSLLNQSGAGENNDQAASAIEAVVPDEIMDKLPPAVKTLATSQVMDQLSKQAPQILEVIGNGGKLTGADAEKLKSIVMNSIGSAGK